MGAGCDPDLPDPISIRSPGPRALIHPDEQIARRLFQPRLPGHIACQGHLNSRRDINDTE